ncbi:MAG: hypothetical protein KAJ09_11515 [Deltaproteobacteria bacterium]|nr:hypothetical protein [Deltaproteobacteria bacterium]
MLKNADVFLIGTGDLGGWVVEFLARCPGMWHSKIVVGDIDEEIARKRAFSAWAGSSYLGQFPEYEFVSIDLFNIDEAGQLLQKYSPRVVCNCTSLQSWWVVDELPRDIWAKMETEAGLGPWEPMHLTLTYKLMQAIKKYEIETLVVNCSFPDLTNPVLGKVGLAPTCGIGNSDLLLPGVRRGVAQKLDIPPRNITMYLVAQHSHPMQFMIRGEPGSPYYLKIMVGDKDVTGQFDLDELILAGMRDWLPGRHFHPVVASSVVKNIFHLLFDTGELSFAPGPNGEVGGYPIRMSAKGVEVVLPEGITMDEARKINDDAQKNDGVERIEDDGTIVFTDKAYGLMKELMGFDCKTLKLEESEARAKELLSLYHELRKKCGLA